MAFSKHPFWAGQEFPPYPITPTPSTAPMAQYLEVWKTRKNNNANLFEKMKLNHINTALFLPTAPLTTPAFLSFLLIGCKLLLKLMHAQLTSRHWVGVGWGC